MVVFRRKEQLVKMAWTAQTSKCVLQNSVTAYNQITEC